MQSLEENNESAEKRGGRLIINMWQRKNPHILQIIVVRSNSGQVAKKVGNKRKRRNRAKAYREIARLKSVMQAAKKTIAKYKKRLQRCQAKTTTNDKRLNISTHIWLHRSPKTITLKEVRGNVIPCSVKKTYIVP